MRSEEAIKSVSEKYGKLCLSIARSILKNEEDAEECVNDAYLALWKAIPPEQPDPLVAYLGKTVRNISLSKYRHNTAEKRNSHYDVVLDELVEGIEGVDHVNEHMRELELAAVINQFLAAQKKADRVIFVKRYFFALEPVEIAKDMDLSTNYVNVHLHRTREKLKKYLKKEGVL